MDRGRQCPPYPEDPALREAIQKLATFVARNGPDFEEMTRQKQAQNPKFSFLFPEDRFYSFYRYCVDCEIDNGQRPQHGGFDEQGVRAQIEQLRSQITQSEANLRAQKDAIPLIKEGHFSQAAMEAENVKIAKLLQNINLDVTPLAQIMEQMNNKCSKDAVSACKKWILETCTNDQMREMVLTYLNYRVRETSSTDQFRLHILYLINDWAHYCQRKHQDFVSQMLSRYVPQMYAWTSECAHDRSMNEKLDKLLGVWEGHKYFNDHCFKQLRNPRQIYQTIKTGVLGEYARLSQDIDAQLMAMVAGYEQQHNDFCGHIVRQIQALEFQINQARNKVEQPKSLLELNVRAPEGMNREMHVTPPRRSRFDQQTREPHPHNSRFDHGPPHPPPRQSRFAMNREESQYVEYPEPEEQEDIDGVEVKEEDLIPKCEYWDTPAGLMIARVEIKDLTYKPIDGSQIRLLPTMPYSQHLNRRLEQFYAQGPDMPPRDEEGWESGALASFFDRKMHIKQLLLDAEGKTIEDLITNRMSQEERDEELREMERGRREARQSVLGQSQEKPEKKKVRSRSRSISKSSRSSSSSRSRSRSRGRGRRSRSYSRSPPRRRSRSARSRSITPIRRYARSPSPDFSMPTQFRHPQTPLGFENKGALLMQKMGWKGAGLGAKETGIQEPINAGEIRDRTDMYKGLGQSSDVFEEYRKQRSGGYHARNQSVFEKRDAARKGGDRDRD